MTRMHGLEKMQKPSLEQNYKHLLTWFGSDLEFFGSVSLPTTHLFKTVSFWQPWWTQSWKDKPDVQTPPAEAQTTKDWLYIWLCALSRYIYRCLMWPQTDGWFPPGLLGSTWDIKTSWFSFTTCYQVLFLQCWPPFMFCRTLQTTEPQQQQYCETLSWNCCGRRLETVVREVFNRFQNKISLSSYPDDTN